MKAVPISDDNVRLMPYGPEHDLQTVEWLNTPELRESFGLSRTITLESHRQWLATSNDVLMWAITDRSDVHVGNVLLHCTWSHRSAYFQIYVGSSDVRGRGVGSTVLRLILDHAFRNLRLHRVWLHTLPGNGPAEHLYEKAGFTREGIEREGLLLGGVFRSQTRWSLLAQEWLSNDRARGS